MLVLAVVCCLMPIAWIAGGVQESGSRGIG